VKKFVLLLVLKTHQELIQPLIKGASFINFPHLLAKDFFQPYRDQIKYDFIFCGRVTAQKNVDEIIHAFINLQKEYSNLRLAIVGKTDNYGYHYLGSDYINGNNFIKKINKYKAITSNVDFLDYKEVEELPFLLGQSKFLISPSSFHEEDFGRIVPEAMANGCYPILSKWGGYKDFISQFDLYDKLETQVTDEGIRKVESELIYQAMKEHLNFEFDRKELTRNARESYCISKKVKNEIIRKHSTFEGVTSNFQKLLNLYVKGYGPVFKNDLELYREVYQCYQ
jgi:glycosyltransferase involved in cell wall biosynthesis